MLIEAKKERAEFNFAKSVLILIFASFFLCRWMITALLRSVGEDSLKFATLVKKIPG